LGKKLKEQGRKLQLQISSANQHLNQLSSAEDKFKAVSTYCKKLSENQDRLNRNGKFACYFLFPCRLYRGVWSVTHVCPYLPHLVSAR